MSPKQSQLQVDLTETDALYGPLRHAELDDGRCRLFAAVTHVLPTLVQVRVANRPGFTGTVPELACGVPCPGQGRLFPGIFHKVLQYDTIRYEMLF